jgi:Bacterial SH3 domain
LETWPMRALLFLSVVGAAIYALLVVTHNVVPDRKAEDTFAGKTQLNHPVDRDLRSWGPNLPALVIAQPPSPQHPQQNVAHAPRPTEENPSQYSERTSGADDQPATSPDNLAAASELDRSNQDHVEWTKVMLAARVHSEASVSSPTIRFYRPGTELQVVSRENGWLQLLDPVTQERGWIFGNYLSSIDGPSRTQAAMDSPIEDVLSEPIPTKPVLPSSKKRSRSAKPATQVFDDVITKSELRRGRWARRDNRRRGFGLF